LKGSAKINKKEKDKTIVTVQKHLGGYLTGFRKFRGRKSCFIVWG
jgi:hypothetical protein